MAARQTPDVVLIVAAVLLTGCAPGRARYNPSLLDRWVEDGSAVATQECGETADRSSVPVGSRVVLHHHRAVEGDPNWIASMRGYEGATTRVTGLDGLDPLGCPVVRVEVDGGRHLWRVRDLTVIGTGLGPGGGDAVPQRCGLDEVSADYGLVQPGAIAILWRHRAVDGEENWIEEMADHVGRQVEVISLGGVDDSGCAVVTVDVDRGEWAWRVRDLTLVRPALPQSCSDSGQEPSHGVLGVGDTVRLGHHRPVDHERSWLPAMEQYVGHFTRVTELASRDDQGCPVVHVEIDHGANLWRVRDLTLYDRVASERAEPTAEEQAPPLESCGQTSAEAAFGPFRVGAHVTLGRHRPVDHDANWSEPMERFVGEEATVTELSGVDAAGCPGVRVDVDGGEHFWRIRDLQIVDTP